MAHYYYSYKSSRSVVDGEKGSLARRATPIATKLPFRFSTNPGQLQDVTSSSPFDGNETGLGGFATTPLLHRTSLGHLSPLRGRTMKEYDHQIIDLKKENFDLKLRIYFIEERLQRKFSDSTDDVHKSNLELKIEVERLKKELSERQELLVKASTALDAMEATHKTELKDARSKVTEQRGQFDEQIRRLQEALELAQQQISKSDGTSNDDSNREELYQQAFAPFPVTTDSTAAKSDMNLDEWQLKIRGLTDEVNRLNVDLSAGQNRIHELERSIADKEAYLKAEEINTVKCHKVIQGLLTNVKNKEKQLSQLQEQFDLQSVELKATKEKLNHILKRASENPSTSTNQDQETDEPKSLKLVIVGLRKEKETLELAWRDAVRQRDETVQGVEDKLSAERQKSQEEIEALERRVQTMQTDIEQQLQNKDEIVKQLRNAVDERNRIIETCLRLTGAINSDEEFSHYPLQLVTEVLSFKIEEKESKIKQTVMEEHVKLMKEKDNEVIRIQESNTQEKNRRQAQFEEELNVAQKTLEDLQSTLTDRDNRIEGLLQTIQDLQTHLSDSRKSNAQQPSNETASNIYHLDNREEEEICSNNKITAANRLRKQSVEMKDRETQAVGSEEHVNDVMCRLQAVLSDKNDESSKLHQQLKMKEDFITNLKGYLEILLNDTSSTNVADELNPTSASGVAISDASYVEQKLADLEERVRTSSTKNKVLDDQLISVRNRMATLRQLIEGFQNGGGDAGKIDAKDLANKNLEDNLQAVFRGVKLMTNLNDIFRQQIQMNSERLDSSNGIHNNSFNPQMIVDMALEIQELKSKAMNCSHCCQQSGRTTLREVVCNHENRLGAEESQRILADVISRRGGCDGEPISLNSMALLHDANDKITKLQQKLASTENTVYLLGKKVKLYRKLLQDSGHYVAPSPQSRDQLSVTFPPMNQDEDKPGCSRDGRDSTRRSTAPRRSVSVDDMRTSQDDKNDQVRNLIEENQAFSADDILSPVTDLASDPKEKTVGPLDESTPKLLEINVEMLKGNSPYTPDSLIDYGQSCDVLELKEQICRLKLLLEEREAQLVNETYSEREVIRSNSTVNNFRHLSHLTSLLKEQSLTPSERNVSGSYLVDGDQTLPLVCRQQSQVDADCQAGDGVVRNFTDSHVFENVDEELQWLHNLNAMLQAQLDVAIREIPEGRYSNYIQLQQQDISSLRHRLLDSHDACEILRVRLEELAEFLEQLLRFDENGFLDLSQFTPQRLESLRRHIAESRQLSHSLSQSLLLDVTDVSNVTNYAEGAASHESMQHFYNNTTNGNIAQCNSSYLKEKQRLNDENGDGSRSATIRNEEWETQNQMHQHEPSDGIWSHGNANGLLRIAEAEPLPSVLGRNFESRESSDKLDGIVSAEREFEWNSRRNSRDNHRFYQDRSLDRYNRNPEPPKTAQSSCDDLILLLDAREHSAPEYRSDGGPATRDVASLYARGEPSGGDGTHSEEPVVVNAIPMYSSNNENEMRSLDTMREQAIMAEYVRHYTSKQFTDDKDRWSSYQQRSNHSVTYRKDGVPEPEMMDGQRNRVVLSPSDSESWSEPDRDVSQQRIGLELDEKQFNVSRDRPHFGRSPKSLKMRSHNLSNSESAGTTDASHYLASAKMTSSPTSNLISRNDSLQIDDLEHRVRNLEDVNNVLRSELKIYQALSTKATSQPDLKGCVTAALPACEGSSTAEKRRNSSGDKVQLVLNEHLIEIRALRLQLEESNRIKEKLEQSLVARQQYVRTHDNKISHLNTEITEKERMIGQLDSQLKHHLRKERELQVEADELHQQVSDLTEKLQTANAQVHQLERDVTSRDESSQQLKHANQRLKESLVNLQSVLADKDRVVKELREANARMQRTLETMDQLMTQQMNEAKERLTMEVNEGKQRVLEVQESQKVAERRAKEALEKVEEMKVVVNRTEALKKDLKRKEEMVIDLRNAMTETERQLEEEHGVRLSLQQKISCLAAEATEKERVMAAAAKEKVLDLEQMVHKAEKEFIEQRDKADKLQGVVNEKDAAVNQLRESLRRMQEAVVEKKRRMERQLEAARALERKVESLNGAASEKEARSEERAKELEVKLKEAHEETKGLTQRLEKQEGVYLDLQVKLDERGTTIRALEDELHKTSEDNERLQQQLLTVKASLSETGELNRSMKSELHIYEHLHANIAYKSTDKASSPLGNRRSSVPASGMLDVYVDQLLNEMRHLRTQLEVSIQTNNALRGQLEEHFMSKLNENTTDPDNLLRVKAFGSPNVQKRFACLSWNGHSLSDAAGLGLVKKSSSLPCDRGDIFPDGDDPCDTRSLFVRQQSKSSDYVSEDQINTPGKETDTKAERPSRLLHVALPTSNSEPGSAERSPLGQTDSHSVYSSPDLGIESDPSHFSSLERKMSDITEEHLVEIRKSQIGLTHYKNGPLSVDRSIGSHGQRSRKGSVVANDDRRFLYAVGRLGDYGIAKKEIEGGMTVMKGLQTKIKEMMQSCPKSSPIKKMDYSTLKELHVRSNNVNTCLGKSLKTLGCFWTATLPAQTDPNDAKLNPKILEENLLLKKKLCQQRNNLQEALSKLAASNRLKEGMEKAIMKQLSKTHDVLKRAKGNLEDKANPKTD